MVDVQEEGPTKGNGAGSRKGYRTISVRRPYSVTLLITHASSYAPVIMCRNPKVRRSYTCRWRPSQRNGCILPKPKFEPPTKNIVSDAVMRQYDL
jgi:hypothetical protein